MKTISAELKARVTATVTECIQKIEKHYNITMNPIKIVYDINSARLGGMAIHSTRTLRVNPTFLDAYTDKYLTTTIPHECAHIGVYDVWATKMFSRSRPSAHGVEWKTMMSRVLGVPANRCHDYAAPEGVQLGKPKTKHHYKCSKCGDDVFCGPKIHAKIIRGSTYHHTLCGRASKLVFADTVGKVSYTQARTIVNRPVQPNLHAMLGIPAAPSVSVPVTPKCDHAGMNKFDRCLAIYMSHPGLHRKAIVSKFVNEVNMTEKGASTYYSKCVKEAAKP